MKAFQPFGLCATNTEYRSNLVGNIRATMIERDQPGQHPANEYRNIGYGRAHFDQSNA